MLEIAKIIGFHGINGELKISYTDRLYRNLSMATTFYLQNAKSELLKVEIEQYRIHKTNILIKLKNYNTKTEVESFKGSLLKQEESMLAPLENEEYFVKDLIGISVYNEEGVEIGIVKDVLTDKASNDLIEIKTTENIIKLIPFVEELVPIVNLTERKLIINSKQGIT